MEKRRKLVEYLRAAFAVSVAIVVPIGGGLGLFEVVNGVPMETAMSAMAWH